MDDFIECHVPADCLAALQKLAERDGGDQWSALRTLLFTDQSRVITTGTMAKMLSCSTRKANQLFDKGLIKGWKLPESRDRRTTVGNVLAMMEQQGYSPDLIERAKRIS